MIAEMYKDEFTVERVDPDTGYVYVNNPWAKAQGVANPMLTSLSS